MVIHSVFEERVVSRFLIVLRRTNLVDSLADLDREETRGIRRYTVELRWVSNPC